jgi:hypothetical protein
VKIDRKFAYPDDFKAIKLKAPGTYSIIGKSIVIRSLRAERCDIPPWMMPMSRRDLAVNNPRSPRTPCFLRSLRRATHRTTAVLLKKAVFNLRVDAMEPLLSPFGSLLISGDFCLQRGDTVFGHAQLIRKLLSHAQRMSAVFVSNASSSLDQLQNG